MYLVKAKGRFIVVQSADDPICDYEEIRSFNNLQDAVNFIRVHNGLDKVAVVKE